MTSSYGVSGKSTNASATPASATWPRHLHLLTVKPTGILRPRPRDRPIESRRRLIGDLPITGCAGKPGRQEVSVISSPILTAGEFVAGLAITLAASEVMARGL